MLILKIIFLSLLVIVIALLIIGFFVRKDYVISRQITIHKPKQDVFNYVKFLKNQNEFSKWAKMDPNMKKEFRGTDATVGFISAWEGNKEVGKGEQEIKAIIEGEKIDYEVRFEKPFKNIAPSTMETKAVNDSTTTVSWTFYSHMPYPMNLMGLFMNMDKAIGSDLQIGLDNLKGILEK